MKRFLTIALIAAMGAHSATAQERLSRETILNMTTDELTELPLEELMQAVETLGLSSVDELFTLIMNKNVSSASKKEEESFRSPLSSSVITNEEIRALGCTTLEEALRLLPGVIVREKTNGSYDIHLRGMDNIPDAHTLLQTENANTLVMIDGRPVFNYVHGATLWESLPVGLADIERIEIVRGASGALYGSNAVSGVINIITLKTSAMTKNVSGCFTMGNMHTNTGDIAFRKNVNDNLGISISANWQRRDRPTDKIFIIPTSGTIDYYDADGKAKGRADEFAHGAYVDIDDFNSLRVTDATGHTYSLLEPESPINDMFPSPILARQNIGINGGIFYDDPLRDLSVSINGGYQQSYIQGTALMSDPFPFNGRRSKTGYVDTRIALHGAQLQLNYFDGPQDFTEGTFGFKMRNQQFNGNVEYEFTPTPSLSVRPGVNYQFTRIGDTDYNNYFAYRDDAQKTASFSRTDAEEWGVSRRRYSSYLNSDCDLSQLAFSLKLDYTVGERLRLIAAGRVDKLRVPDKAFPSWLASATYTINHKNVVRAVASRANRSGILINTSSNYEWVRSDLGSPDYMIFSGNEDADVMHATNYEIGYRLRPNQYLLIDMEAYMTISEDYGALMSVNSQTTTSGSDLYTGIRNMDNFLDQQRQKGVNLTTAASAMSDANFRSDFSDFLRDFVNTVSYVQYQNLPYKVRQMGVSASADWIVSQHLVAKMNVTVQKTTIDNHFTYQQSAAFEEQIDACYNGLMNVMMDLHAHDKKYVANAFQTTDAEAWLAANSWFTASEADMARLTDPADEHFNPALYYNLAHKMKESIDPKSGDMIFAIGDARYNQAKLRDGHKHKYTPAFFGSVSLIYKPIREFSIAPSAYFYGKQEALTSYNASGKPEEIKGKFVMNMKLTYHTGSGFDIFLNAVNLLNDKRREFVYGDKIGGRYSIGVNYGF